MDFFNKIGKKRSTAEKVNITIKFYIFEKVWVQYFSLN